MLFWRFLDRIARPAHWLGWIAILVTLALAQWPGALRLPLAALAFLLLFAGLVLWLARFLWDWGQKMRGSSKPGSAWPGAGNPKPLRIRNIDFFGVDGRLVLVVWLLVAQYVYFGDPVQPGSPSFWALSALIYAIGSAVYTRTPPPRSNPVKANSHA